ncbi:MAG: RimK family alpha-L-glutamate ligase [Parachlamydiales bacterium]
MKGWVLFFRKGSELEESDYSVRRLVEAAVEQGIELEVLAPQQFEIVANRDDRRSILIDNVPRELPDFVIPRMGSQTTYYARAILRQLEHLGVPTINSSQTIEHVSDKLYIAQKLAQSALPTPRTMLAKPTVDGAIVEREIGFPAVIKTLSGTSGRGVHLCQDREAFRDLTDLIYENSPTANLIVQELVKSSLGRDIRVFVVGGRVVGCMERRSKGGFKANVALGGSVVAYPVDKELELLALEVCRLFNLEIAGVDLLFTETGYTICEANSAPGFIGMEQVTGKVIAEEIMEYIRIHIGAKGDV